MRDSRIAAIYEGANGIHGDRPRAAQAAARRRRDRRATRSPGSATSPGRCRSAAARPSARPARGSSRRSRRSNRRRATCRGWLGDDTEFALAGAAPYLRLFGLTLGGACLAKAGLAAAELRGGRRFERALPRRPRALLRREAAAGRAGARTASSPPGAAALQRLRGGPGGRDMSAGIEIAREGAVLVAAFARPGEEERHHRRDVRGADRGVRRGRARRRTSARSCSRGRGGVFTAGNDIADFLSVAAAGGARTPRRSPPCRFVTRLAEFRKAARRRGRRARRSASERRSASIATSSTPRRPRGSTCRSSISASCPRPGRRCSPRSGSAAPRRPSF